MRAPFCSRVSFGVYNPMKSTKYGLKMHVPADIKMDICMILSPFRSGSVILNTELIKTIHIVKALETSVITKNEDNLVMFHYDPST